MTLLRYAPLLLLAACVADADAPEVDTVARSQPCPMFLPGPLHPVITHANNHITANENWQAQAYHVIPQDTTISATVQIGACAVVELGGGKTLTIGAGGNLATYANATAGGVTFTRADASTAWNQIRIEGGTASLIDAVITGGGVANQGALFVSSGNLTEQGTWIYNAAGYGLDVGANATITSSSALFINGTAAPVRVDANRVSQLPAGGGYTGNTSDVIVIPVPGHVQTSQTWQDLGVPYQIGDGISAGQLQVFDSTGGLTTLTINKNVTLKFRKNTGMQIEPLISQTSARGALYAVGTQQSPIVFTSGEATQAPGDWIGVMFGSAIAPNTTMQFTAVVFGGGNSGFEVGCAPNPNVNFKTDGDILIVTNAPPPDFLKNNAIGFSASTGIVRGWDGAASPDFSVFNGFGSLASCKQSNPRPPSGRCTPCT